MDTEQFKQTDKRLYNIHHEMKGIHKTAKGLKELLTEGDDKMQFTRSEKRLDNIIAEMKILNRIAQTISFLLSILTIATLYQMWF